jgi:hypothetical protein
MIVSHEHKFIFVKTRKTAGSTFEKLMRPYLGPDDICTGSTRDDTPALNINPDTNGHLPLTEIRARYFPKGIDIAGYDIISIERNPYDKVVSSYYWHQHIKPDQFGKLDFELYMRTCNLLPSDWGLYTLGGLIPPKLKMFHYESMDELYLWLKKSRSVHIVLDKVGQTRLKSGIRKVQDYKELHTGITKRVVDTVFAKELKEFSYEF